MIDFREKFGLKNLKIEKKTPDHGACCQCQTCGFDYDDCHCQQNTLVEMAMYYEKLGGDHLEVLKECKKLQEMYDKTVTTTQKPTSICGDGKTEDTTPKPKPVMIWDKKKGKQTKAGDFNDGVFYKNVDPKRHYMRMYSGYGIQEEALLALRGHCQLIVINDGNEIRCCSFDDWVNNNTFADHGHGVQWFYNWDLMEPIPKS